MKTYHVELQQSGWVVRLEGTPRGYIALEHRTDAIRICRNALRNDADAEIVIHNADGSIERSERPALQIAR
jgi:hypothetical protein